MRCEKKIWQETTINTISFLILIGFFSAVVFTYIMNTAFHQSYPYSTFLFQPKDQFNDFIHIYNICKGFNPYNANYFFSSNYFPFTNALFFLFTLISPKQLSMIVFFLLFLILYSIIACYVNHKYSLGLSPISSFLIFCMNYPLLFALDRANIELYLFIFISVFLISYINKRYVLAAIFLAFAVSMKLFPAVFFIMFIREKKWKETLIFILTCFAITTVSLFFHQGGIIHNFLLMIRQMNGFGLSYDSLVSYHFNNSFAGLFIVAVAWLLQLFGHRPRAVFKIADRIQFNNLYTIIVLLFFICLCIYLWKNRTNLRYTVLVLTISMISLPVISYDYKLIHMLIPLLFFIRTDEKIVPYLITLLMIPKPYYFIFNDISVGVIINSSLLFLLLAIAFFRIVLKNEKTMQPVIETCNN